MIAIDTNQILNIIGLHQLTRSDGCTHVYAPNQINGGRSTMMNLWTTEPECVFTCPDNKNSDPEDLIYTEMTTICI